MNRLELLIDLNSARVWSNVGIYFSLKKFISGKKSFKLISVCFN